MFLRVKVRSKIVTVMWVKMATMGILIIRKDRLRLKKGLGRQVSMKTPEKKEGSSSIGEKCGLTCRKLTNNLINYL